MPCRKYTAVCSIISVIGNNKGDCDDNNDNDDLVLLKKTLILLVRAPYQSG
jgi:hypothetical protein